MATDTITATRGGAIAAQWPALLLWAAVVGAAWAIGVHLDGIDPRMHVGAAPLVGSYDLRLGPGILPAATLGLAGAVWGPALAARLHFGALLAAAWGASAAWALALASAGGAAARWHPHAAVT